MALVSSIPLTITFYMLPIPIYSCMFQGLSLFNVWLWEEIFYLLTEQFERTEKISSNKIATAISD